MAAVFAAHGFVSLALAYFGVDDLPKEKHGNPLDIAYFEEAVDFLRSRNEVIQNQGVSLWSISQGGTIALAMAALLGDKIHSVVLINSIFKSMMQPILYKGNLFVPAYTFDPVVINKKAKDLGNNIRSIQGWEKNEAFEHNDQYIPFYESDAKFLYVASEDDGIGDFVRHGQMAKETMKSKGKGDNFQMVTCPGAGHYIDLPFSPVLNVNVHALIPKPFLLHYGGQNRELHSRSQENAWDNIMEFLFQ